MKAEIAIKAADLAIQSIGIKEQGGDNRGDMIKKYLACINLEEGFAWCCGFAKYMFIKAAGFLNEELSEEFMKLDGWSPSWKSYAQKHKIWISVEEAKKDPTLIKKGYVVLFYSSEKERIYHVGIVLSSNKTGVLTCEGNTSSNTPGVDANGGMVAQKRRTWTHIGREGGFMKTY